MPIERLIMPYENRGEYVKDKIRCTEMISNIGSFPPIFEFQLRMFRRGCRVGIREI